MACSLSLVHRKVFPFVYLGHANRRLTSTSKINIKPIKDSQEPSRIIKIETNNIFVGNFRMGKYLFYISS